MARKTESIDRLTQDKIDDEIEQRRARAIAQRLEELFEERVSDA